MAESGLPLGRDATPLWLTKVQQHAGGAVWLCLQQRPRVRLGNKHISGLG